MKRSPSANRIRLPMVALREIEAVYATIPSIDCKGLCHESCGPILMSKLEQDRITARVGREVLPNNPFQEVKTCPLLKDGKCSVYDIRPTICRMWGVAEGMRCPFGCEVKRVLDRYEGGAILAEAHRVSRRLYE